MKQLTFFLLLMITISLFSQKADIVMVHNGDEITGEVKSLQDNVLNFKTDDMGTLKIKWDKVVHLVSKNIFRVELKNGLIIFGSLDSTQREGFVRVLSDSSWTEVKSEEIVGILKINQTIIGRFDGDIGLGYSFTKSSTIHQINANINLSYLANKNLSELKSSAILTSQQDSIFTSKADLSLSQTRLFNHHLFTTVSWSLQQNSELGIQRRSLFSFTYGKNFIKRNRMLLLLSAGLATNNEKYYRKADGLTHPDDLALESVFKLEFKSFSNNEPEFNVHPYLIIYPSLTSWGRVRSDFNIDVRFELIHDLYFTLRYYNQLDNKPPEGDNTTDYGITTSLDFSF
jgi:putative salt-induced outer membrane protein YdiY